MRGPCERCKEEIEGEPSFHHKTQVRQGYHVCPLVACDDPTCLAKEHPVTGEELRAALEHWRDHSCLCGCSHGR